MPLALTEQDVQLAVERTDTNQAVTRTLLGVGVDPADLPAGGALQPAPGRGVWMARRGVSHHFTSPGG